MAPMTCDLRIKRDGRYRISADLILADESGAVVAEFRELGITLRLPSKKAVAS